MRKLSALLLAALLLLTLASCTGFRRHTVTFETGTDAGATTQKVWEGDKVKRPQDPEKEGYAFDEWTCRGQAWSFEENGVTEDITLTATWQPIYYVILYDLKGGENASENPAGFTVESEEIVLGAPTRENYVFTGWTLEGQTEPQLTVTVPAGSRGSRMLTANWAVDYNAAVTVTAGGIVFRATDFGKTLSVIEIPAARNGTAARKIDRQAFSGCGELTIVVIPASVTEIGDMAFDGCTALTDILYPGTMAQWQAISKGNDWDGNTGAYTVHCTDGDLNKTETA